MIVMNKCFVVKTIHQFLSQPETELMMIIKNFHLSLIATT